MTCRWAMELVSGPLPKVSASRPAKSSSDYFTRAVLSQFTRVSTMSADPRFELVCIKCDSLGIVLDCAEGAPSSTQIKCSCCGSLRGTLGDLRYLAGSNQHETRIS